MSEAIEDSKVKYVETTTISEGFKIHLDESSNIRLILSGKFGSGKTTFINKFFEKNKSYECIRIAPVNYTVAANEDVFELIKYDVLFQLIGKIELEEKETSFIEEVKKYVGNNKAEFLKLFTPFLKMIPLVGNSLSATGDRLINFTKGISDKLDEVSSEKDDVENYFAEFAITRGSIYEEDIFTLLIRKLIEQLRGKDKKAVLVVDDLDRIDPEHIFRILNVFAAHNDIHADNTNKFDFDKVIAVCDIENIRNIFQHKYGGKTDFNGYIDKFYSKEVFEFDSSEYVKEVIESTIRSVKLSEYSAFRSKVIEQDHFREFIVKTLNYMVEINGLSFRRITQVYESNYVPKEEVFYINSPFDRRVGYYKYMLLPILNFMWWMLGGVDKLEANLKAIIHKVDPAPESVNQLLNVLILPVLSLGEKVECNGTSCSYTVNKLTIDFKDTDNPHISIVKMINDTPVHQSINIYEWLYEAFLVLNKKGLIK